VRGTPSTSIVLSVCSLLVLSGCAGAGASRTPGASAPGASATSFASASPANSAPPASSPSPTESARPPATSLPSGCVNPPPDLSAIVALDASTRLTCFGGSSLTFAATVSKAILDCGIGPRVEPAWFCLPGVFLAVPNASPDSGVVPLDVYWNPSSGLTPASFPADKTVQITGHFDDPAASTCHVTSVPAGQSSEPSDQVVLTCRETFIVTAAR
jgi:hypothetical protein